MLTFTNLRCKPRFICDIQFSGFHIIIIIIIIVSSETYIYILYIYILYIIYIYIYNIYIYIYIHFPALVDDPSNLNIEESSTTDTKSIQSK